MERYCWQAPEELSFPRPLNGFLPHHSSLGIFSNHNLILHEGLCEEINQSCSLVTEKILAFSL